MNITPVPENNPEVGQQLTNLAEFIKYIRSEEIRHIGVPARYNIPKMKKLKFKTVEPKPLTEGILYAINEGYLNP